MDLIYFLIDFILHIDVHLAELVAEYGVWVYASQQAIWSQVYTIGSS